MSGRARDWDALQRLFLAYRRGDASAVKPLFKELDAVIAAFYRARLGSPQDARDLTQACLLKLHVARDRYDAARSLKTWVFTVAGRSLIDHWRGRRPAGEDEHEAAESLAAPGLNHGERYDFGHDLERAMAVLKPIDRSLVYLYAAEGLSMAEAAEALGLTEAAAKVRAHRAYVKLRATLAEESS